MNRASSGRPVRRLDGRLLQQVVEALTRTFTSVGQLEMLVQYALNENLQNIAAGVPLRECTFKLIVWTEARGRTGALLEKARDERKTHAEFVAWVDDVLAKLSESADETPPETASPEFVRLIEGVVATLKRRVSTAMALARQLGLAVDLDGCPYAVAMELVGSSDALRVAKAMNLADAEIAQSGAPREDMDAMREILWQVLPCAKDMRTFVRVGRDAFKDGTSVTLELCTETMAEIALAGVDGRLCRFTLLEEGTPAGIALVRVPAAAQTILFDLDGTRLMEFVVEEVLRALKIGGQIPRALRNRQRLVNGRLAFHLSEAPASERHPFYLLYIDAVMDDEPAGSDAIEKARSHLAREFPSLRFVRLTGDSFDTETQVAAHIESILRRTPSTRSTRS